MEKYFDRYAAGNDLAQHLLEYARRSDVLVLGLPRGGVPVAFEVAKVLVAPLDVFIVRKLGVPGHEELAMGALAMGGLTVFNDHIVRQFALSTADIQQAIKQESQELQRRDAKYRGNRPFPIIKNKTVLLIDDGIATGATLRAAIQAIKQFSPARLIVAVPVAAWESCEQIGPLVDQLVCPLKSHHFYAVGQWYDDFSQTTDEEVSSLLKKAGQWRGANG